MLYSINRTTAVSENGFHLQQLRLVCRKQYSVLVVFSFVSTIINFNIYNFKDTSNCMTKTSYIDHWLCNIQCLHGNEYNISYVGNYIFVNWHTYAVHFIFYLNSLAIIFLKFETHLVGRHPCVSPSVILLMCGGFFKFTCGVVVLPALHYFCVSLGPRFLCLQTKRQRIVQMLNCEEIVKTNSTCNETGA